MIFSREVALTKEEFEKQLESYFNKTLSILDQSEKPTRMIKPLVDLPGFLKDNLNDSSDWVSFYHYFEKVHIDFFNNLKQKHPSITTKELNMCALLKLNLENKDIAQVLGISHDSVRKAQSRLLSKLNLPQRLPLRDYIIKS